MAPRDSLAEDQTELANDRLPELEGTLRRAATVLSEERVLEVSRLLDRWRDRTFVALIVGEFKRGKSTLLNALIGQDLLPTGIPPVTAVPTRVRSGARARALVRFRDGSERAIGLEEVRAYVDESLNPGNQRAVVSVDVEVTTGPPLGVVLVDVPGLGSTHKHNTEAALAALPEADAAIVVASVDPPVGEAELRLLHLVRDHAPRLDLVLNKVDYLDEEGRRTAEAFTRCTLGQEGFAEVRVWPVSARDGLRARACHDDLGWRRSGMEAFASSLGRFFEEERTALLARSLARKTRKLVEQELALLEMQSAAAERSSAQLGEIIGRFRSGLVNAARDSDEAILVFRRRFDSIFAGYAERAAEAWKSPRDLLESRRCEIGARGARRSRRAVWQTMQDAAREAVDAFAAAFVPQEAQRLADAYRELCAEIGQAAAERAERVWRLAADLLPFEPPAVEAAPAAPAPRPSLSPDASLHLLLEDLEDAAAWLLPRGAALRRLAGQAREEGDARYGRAVEQSRETFSRAYEDHFRGVLEAFDVGTKETARAIEAALAAAEEQARAVETGRRDATPVDVARRSALRELAATLRQIEADAAGDRGSAGPRQG